MHHSSTTQRRQAARWHGLRAVLALLAALPLVGLAHAQTAAGTVVTNVASATFVASDGSDRSTPSNPIDSTVAAICGLAISPDGTLAAPGHSVVAQPGETVTLPYLFTSAANLSADFDLETLIDPASALAPASVAVHLDLNGNGLLDPGEPAITDLTGVAPGETVPLLLVITLADDDSVAGDVFIDVVGRCAADPSIVDQGNIARIAVAREGVRDFVKDAVPAAGTALAPGDAVTYTVRFTTNEFELVDAVLSDTLDPLLDAPTALGVTLDGVPQAGLALYDAGTRTVSATFATLPPGSAVELVVTAAVRDDAPAGAAIRNQATLVHDVGSDDSNVVEHEVLGVCRIALTPDGTVAAPGQSVAVVAGFTAVLSYQLRNTGNVPIDADLSTVVLGASDVAPLDVRIVLDVDGDGVPGPDDPVVTSLSELPVGDTVALLVLVDLPAGAPVDAEVYVDLVAACGDDPTVTDDGNVGRVVIAPIGFDGPLKMAQPASGTAVFPAAPLRYEITFTAGPAALSDVVVSDVLDPALEPPSLVTDGIVTDPATGQSAVATAEIVGGTVTWRIAEVPAGMTVTLVIETAVRRDVPEGTIVRNQARVDAGDAGWRDGNVTEHPVREIRIAISKVSEPDLVRPGGRLSYVIVVTNPSSDVALPEMELVDALPAEVRYLSGSTRVRFADGTDGSLEPEIVDDATLRWTLPPLAPGERHELRFDVRALPDLPDGSAIVNRAEVVAVGADGAVAAAAAASAATLVVPGVMSGRSVLLGTAFIDVERTGMFDRDVDVPLAGLRLYLPDGRSTITDVDGRYAFPDLVPGVTSLKLDATTLPPRWLDRTPAEVSDGLWRLTLWPGTITRQDLPFAPPEAALTVRERLTVTMGPVTLEKAIAVTDAGEAGEATWVVLRIAVSDAVRGLAVIDELPSGAALLTPPERADGATLDVDGLTIALGDVAAGDVIEVRYRIDPSDAPRPLMPPRIRWELR